MTSFVWLEGQPVSEAVQAYLESYLPDMPDRSSAEVNLDALAWMERISRSLTAGWVFTIDYGYTSRESVAIPGWNPDELPPPRPRSEDVLSGPGDRDITAHICFTAIEEHGKRLGFETARL